LYLRQGVEEQTLEMFSVPARQTRVLVRAAGLSEGILSPDEQQVAFSVRSDGVHSRIHLAPIQSAGTPSSWRAMTPAAGWADKPRWSPDGKSLFFYSERDGFGCIWRQAMERGQPVGEPVIAKHLHQAQHAIFHLSRQAFSLSAGPDFVVYNEPTVRGNLWMMSQGETVGGRPDWLGWIRSVPPFSLEVLAWEN
jgi:dipeptidyl aminopeptidase/acylaminoacyl peptidase